MATSKEDPKFSKLQDPHWLARCPETFRMLLMDRYLPHFTDLFICRTQAETELRTAQADYDAQLEKVRKALKKIVETHVNHMGYLKTFMVAQREYFAECQAHLGDLEGGPVR